MNYVVVCTDLSDKQQLEQVGVDKVTTPGSPGGVMVRLSLESKTWPNFTNYTDQGCQYLS